MNKNDVSLAINPDIPGIDIQLEKNNPVIPAKPKIKENPKELFKTTIPANLKIIECERMRARGTSMPCGKKDACWYPDKCEKNPLSERPKGKNENKYNQFDFTAYGE